MEVYTFRIILILLGGSLIFGLLIWDRWHRAKRYRERIEPSLGSEEDLLHSGMDVPDQRLGLSADLEVEVTEPTFVLAKKAPPSEMLVQFQVVARADASFPGLDLQAALQEQAMTYGAMQLFHRFTNAPSKQPLFSAASLVEPGYFELSAMARKTYSGLVLFMRLPGPKDGTIGFRELLQTSYSLAHRLGGYIQDAKGQPLEQKTLERIQREISTFQQSRSQKEATV